MSWGAKWFTVGVIAGFGVWTAVIYRCTRITDEEYAAFGSGVQPADSQAAPRRS